MYRNHQILLTIAVQPSFPLRRRACLINATWCGLVKTIKVSSLPNVNVDLLKKADMFTGESAYFIITEVIVMAEFNLI